MNRNFIDFPPWRKSRGLLQDLPLLTQDLVLAPQPLQLGRHVLLPLLGRVVDHDPLGSAAPLAEPELDRVTVAVDRPVKIHPASRTLM